MLHCTPLTPPAPLRLSCRPLLSERAVLARADGSAKWAQEGSAVLAAVHGPHQAGQRREDAERAVIEVLLKPRNGMAGAAQRQLLYKVAGMAQRGQLHL
jgi:exosome complex component RRP46